MSLTKADIQIFWNLTSRVPASARNTLQRAHHAFIQYVKELFVIPGMKTFAKEILKSGLNSLTKEQWLNAAELNALKNIFLDITSSGTALKAVIESDGLVIEEWIAEFSRNIPSDEKVGQRPSTLPIKMNAGKPIFEKEQGPVDLIINVSQLHVVNHAVENAISVLLDCIQLINQNSKTNNLFSLASCAFNLASIYLNEANYIAALKWFIFAFSKCDMILQENKNAAQMLIEIQVELLLTIHKMNESKQDFSSDIAIAEPAVKYMYHLLSVHPDSVSDLENVRNGECNNRLLLLAIKCFINNARQQNDVDAAIAYLLQISISILRQGYSITEIIKLLAVIAEEHDIDGHFIVALPLYVQRSNLVPFLRIMMYALTDKSLINPVNDFLLHKKEGNTVAHKILMFGDANEVNEYLNLLEIIFNHGHIKMVLNLLTAGKSIEKLLEHGATSVLHQNNAIRNRYFAFLSSVVAELREEWKSRLFVVVQNALGQPGAAYNNLYPEFYKILTALAEHNKTVSQRVREYKHKMVNEKQKSTVVSVAAPAPQQATMQLPKR